MTLCRVQTTLLTLYGGEGTVTAKTLPATTLRAKIAMFSAPPHCNRTCIASGASALTADRRAGGLQVRLVVVRGRRGLLLAAPPLLLLALLLDRLLAELHAEGGHAAGGGALHPRRLALRQHAHDLEQQRLERVQDTFWRYIERVTHFLTS